MRLGTRLVAATVLSVSIAAVLASVFGYTLARRNLNIEVDTGLRRDAKRVAQAYVKTLANSGDTERLPLLAAAMTVAIVDDSGRILGSTFDPESPLDPSCGRVAAGELPDHTSYQTVDGHRTRFMCVDMPDQVTPLGIRAPRRRALAKGLAIMVGHDVEGFESRQRGMALGFGMIGVLSTGFAALLTMFITRDATRQVRTLADVTTAVSTDLDLFRTVTEEGPAELQQLGISFNRMIGALIESRDRQRRLIDDAAHELRTPVTSLKTNIAMLQRADRLDPGDRESILEQVNSQLNELTSLIDDVHLLADDSALGRSAFRKLNLATVVQSALARIDGRRSGVEIRSDLQPSMVMGSADELERAVVNVLDNAIKWSPPHGVVLVDLHSGVLRISDDGPGIAVEDRRAVFERFWRSSSSRPMPGSGLGLAIVADIVQRHRGTVCVEDSTVRAQGTTVAIAIPRIADRQPSSATFQTSGPFRGS